MNPWVIAAACMARDLSPQETRAVHALLTSQVPAPDTLNAAQAQRAITAAISTVLRQNNRFTTREDEQVTVAGAGTGGTSSATTPTDPEPTTPAVRTK
jgi:hypothetical protein